MRECVSYLLPSRDRHQHVLDPELGAVVQSRALRKTDYISSLPFTSMSLIRNSALRNPIATPGT